MVAFHYERDFDMIFYFKGDQNLVADQNRVKIFFISALQPLHVSLVHVSACSFAVSQASDLALQVGYVAKEDFNCEKYSDMIFHSKTAQNFVADHYVRDFYMIFHFKEAQNLVADHYEIDFEIISSLKRLKTWLR